MTLKYRVVGAKTLFVQNAKNIPFKKSSGTDWELIASAIRVLAVSFLPGKSEKKIQKSLKIIFLQSCKNVLPGKSGRLLSGRTRRLLQGRTEILLPDTSTRVTPGTS